MREFYIAVAFPLLGVSVMDVKKGLEGLVVDVTRKSLVDGENGKLVICGYDIAELCEKSTFEESIFLVWNERLPTKSELDSLSQRLTAEMQLSPPMVGLLESFPVNANPMDVLRTALSAYAVFHIPPPKGIEKSRADAASTIVGQIASLVPAWGRISRGTANIAPRGDLSIAGNFLYMLQGSEASKEETRILDEALIMHIDHNLNASTFTARVVASTMADLYGAVTAGIAALKGPLHGGANEKALKELQDIWVNANQAYPQPVEQQVLDKLARKEKIMGIGHREYKVKDPRSSIIEEHAKRLAPAGLYQTAKTVEEVMVRERGLYPNVDFFSGMVYEALGIPSALFTPLFAVSRAPGWIAHVQEQYADNRIIRPRAEYVGEPLRSYVPIEKR